MVKVDRVLYVYDFNGVRRSIKNVKVCDSYYGASENVNAKSFRRSGKFQKKCRRRGFTLPGSESFFIGIIEAMICLRAGEL